MEDLFEDRPKLNLWDKISLWWRFEGRYYHKFLREGIANIIYWFPIIWKDRNWDSGHIFTILQHKLKAQAKYIGDKDRHTRAQLDAKRMTICINLIQKHQDGFYEMEYMDYHKDRTWFTPCEDRPGSSLMNSEVVWENFDDYFAKYPLVYKRVINGEGIFSLEDHGNVSTDRKQRIAMNIGYINQDRAHKLLFKIMQENIQGWWD